MYHEISKYYQSAHQSTPESYSEMSLCWLQMDVLCTHPMFGPDSGKGSWGGLNFMYDKVRIGAGSQRQARIDGFLQVGPVPATCNSLQLDTGGEPRR